MEKSCHNAGGVETHICYNACHANRVDKVRLSRSAKLPCVHVLRKRVGFRYQVGICARVIGLDLLDQVVNGQIALPSSESGDVLKVIHRAKPLPDL
jgi:hypothetical protein